MRDTRPGIGFSMHPRWAEMGGLAGFLDPLRAAGLDTLEFELDSRLPDWPGFQPLMQAASDLGMELCFHAPYRQPYSLQGFASAAAAAVIAETRPMLHIAEAWAERKGRPLNVVIHGGAGAESDRDSLREDTLQMLSWVLDAFPGLHFALENNHPAAPGQIKVGERRAAVLEMVRAIGHPRLGICWDMGHDYLAGNAAPASSEWLARVVHAHVHDVDAQGLDHFPLVFGRVPYREWLSQLAGAPALGRVITLEIKGGQLSGMPPAQVREVLIHSIAMIRQSFP